MPANHTPITRTGVGAAFAVEGTLVALYTVPANTTLYIKEFAVSGNVLSTFWIATGGFVHIYQTYLAGGAGGHFSTSLAAPLVFAAAATVLVRCLAVGAAYTEASWTGVIIS